MDYLLVYMAKVVHFFYKLMDIFCKSKLLIIIIKYNEKEIFAKKYKKNLVVTEITSIFASSKIKTKRCAGGGTGRRVCLRGISEFYWVQVQVLSGAQNLTTLKVERFSRFFFAN